jgi:hypothetical protein
MLLLMEATMGHKTYRPAFKSHIYSIFKDTVRTACSLFTLSILFQSNFKVKLGNFCTLSKPIGGTRRFKANGAEKTSFF